MNNNIPQPTSNLSQVLANRAAESAEIDEVLQMQQEDATDNMVEEQVGERFTNLMKQEKGKSKDLKDRISLSKTEKTEKAVTKVMDVESAKKLAEGFVAKHPTLANAKKLMELRAKLEEILQKKEDVTPEEILEIINDIYPDATTNVVDLALSFLSQITEGQVKTRINEARDLWNSKFGKQIRAFHNLEETMFERSRSSSIQEAKSFGELYINIAHSPEEKTPHILYEKIKNASLDPNGILNFALFEQNTQDFLKSLGHELDADIVYEKFKKGDRSSKVMDEVNRLEMPQEEFIDGETINHRLPGASIDRAHLHQLMQVIKGTQAYLQVFKECEQRESLREKLLVSVGYLSNEASVE